MERSLALIALFAAFIAALGIVPPLSLGFGVPITAQSFGIMMCGTVLGAKRGGLAALLFVGLVAIGLPLLSGGRGGIGMFTTGSAGYLVGFVLGAFVTGWVMENLRSMSLGFAAAVAAAVGGIFVVHLCGIIGLVLVLGLGPVQAIVADLAFIPGDLIKVAWAGIMTSALARVRPGSVLSRA